MNKQEAIERIESNALNIGANDLVLGLNVAKHIINQINEPQKIAVPKFVADWYEENKDDFESNLYKLFVDYYNCYLGIEMMTWFHDKHNNPIQTLTAMHQVGYTIKEEKEKLYTVELPNPNAGGHVVLCKTSYGIVSIAFAGMARWKGGKNFQLTENEIKENFDWAWQFAKEVEE